MCGEPTAKRVLRSRKGTQSPEPPKTWQHVPVGTIVERSAHWCRERGGHARGQLGILTDVQAFEPQEPGEVGLQFWPVIHWEGELFGSLTHPLNAGVRR